MAKRHKLSKSSLHWFVKSRPYVLVADVRRRFDLDEVDEIASIELSDGRAYVGLPQRAGKILEELVRENRIGLELAADLAARTVIGVFAYDLLRQPIGLQRSAPPRALEMEDGPPDEDDVEGEQRSVPSPQPRAGVPPFARRPPRPIPDRQEERREERGESPPRPQGGPPSARPPREREPREGAERRDGGRPDVPGRDRRPPRRPSPDAPKGRSAAQAGSDRPAGRPDRPGRSQGGGRAGGDRRRGDRNSGPRNPPS
jgi:hypothetical protein